MHFVKFEVHGIGTVAIREQATNAAKEAARKSGKPVTVTGYMDDGRTREVTFNPDGTHTSAKDGYVGKENTMYKTIDEAFEILLKADPAREYAVVDTVTDERFEDTAANVLNALLSNAMDRGISPMPEDPTDEECWALLEYAVILNDRHSTADWKGKDLFEKVCAKYPVKIDQ